MRHALISFLVVSASCSDASRVLPADAPPTAIIVVPDTTPVNGTRLRASWFQAREGARIFLELTDSTTGAACLEAPAADGQVRCLPRSGSSAFADPDCTQPAARIFVGFGSPPPLVSLQRSDGYHVYRTGEQLGITYSHTAGGPVDCAPDFHGIAPGDAFVRVGEEVSSSDFVAVEERDEPIGGRLAMHMIEGADGTRLFIRLDDEDLGTACAVKEATDGTLRCLPGNQPYDFFYTDSACADMAHAVVSGTNSPPFLANVLGCTGIQIQVVDVGDAVAAPATTFMLDQDGECFAATALGPTTHAVVPLPPERFAEVWRDGRPAGSRRLEPARSTPDRTPDRFFDRTLDTDCFPIPDASGSYRCWPDTIVETTTVCADAGCTAMEPAILIPRAAGCRTPTPPAYVQSRSEKLYQVLDRVHDAGCSVSAHVCFRAVEVSTDALEPLVVVSD